MATTGVGVVANNTSGLGQTQRGKWLDQVLPPELPPEIDRLLNLAFRDGSARFQLGAADQLIAALIRAFCRRSVANEHLIIGIPRGNSDLAILAGFVAQLLRLQAWQETAGADALAFTGPVVVVARDTAVQARLARVGLRGAHFRAGMAGAVSACRVRADGRIVEPDGTLTDYSLGRRRLLYLNSRVGWPSMDVWDGFGVIDRTALRDPRSYRRALEWTRRRCARTVTITDIDDPQTTAICKQLSVAPVVFSLTPAVFDDLKYVIGKAPGASKLTANPLLGWQPSIQLRSVSRPDPLEQALWTGFSALSAARAVGRGTEYPFSVRKAARLLAAVQSCVVDIKTYGREAVGDPRLRSGSPWSMRRTLERTSGKFYGAWKSFGATDWAALRNSAMSAYDECLRHNPKRLEMVDAVETQRRRTPTAKIRIRVPNRVAARVLTDELKQRGVLDSRMQVSAWSERRPWLDADCEIWCGVPPWHHRSMLYSAEATDKEVIAYRGEWIALRGASEGAATRLNEESAAAAAWFTIDPPPSVVSPVPSLPDFSHALAPSPPVSLDIDFDRVVSAASEALADIGEADESQSASLSDETKELRPLGIGDGLVWWLATEDAVGTLVHDHYRHRLVTDLRVGDLVVVPRGEGREELFTRLVQALHSSADVTDLDRMLARFRKACSDLYLHCGQNWAEANRRLKKSGAQATSQIRQWASGETIAPHHAGDVRVVARLVGDRELEDRWKSVDAVAREIRSLHMRLGRVISSALQEALEGEGPSLETVRSFLDIEGLEILDEFAVHRILSIGEPRPVAASAHGSVTKGNTL